MHGRQPQEERPVLAVFHDLENSGAAGDYGGATRTMPEGSLGREDDAASSQAVQQSVVQADTGVEDEDGLDAVVVVGGVVAAAAGEGAALASRGTAHPHGRRHRRAPERA